MLTNLVAGPRLRQKIHKLTVFLVLRHSFRGPRESPKEFDMEVHWTYCLEAWLLALALVGGTFDFARRHVLLHRDTTPVYVSASYTQEFGSETRRNLNFSIMPQFLKCHYALLMGSKL